jgi:hypothetical protein
MTLRNIDDNTGIFFLEITGAACPIKSKNIIAIENAFKIESLYSTLLQKYSSNFI